MFWENRGLNKDFNPKKLIAYINCIFSAIIYKKKGQDNLTKLRQKDRQPFGKFIADFKSALTRAGGYS